MTDIFKSLLELITIQSLADLMKFILILIFFIASVATITWRIFERRFRDRKETLEERERLQELKEKQYTQGGIRISDLAKEEAAILRYVNERGNEKGGIYLGGIIDYKNLGVGRCDIFKVQDRLIKLGLLAMASQQRVIITTAGRKILENIN